MEKGHANHEDRHLLVMFIVLCVLIVGLVVIMIVIPRIKGQNNSLFADSLQEGAASVDEEIAKKIDEGNGELDLELAEKLYIEQINKYDGDDKLLVIMKYSAFVYNNELDAYKALNILKDYTSYLTKGMVTSQYYEAMASLYNVVGDTDSADYYIKLSFEVWPENPARVSDETSQDKKEGE